MYTMNIDKLRYIYAKIADDGKDSKARICDINEVTIKKLCILVFPFHNKNFDFNKENLTFWQR